MQIDCYGFEATSQFFKRKELDAHLMKRVEGVLYVCFGGDAMRPIHRLDKDADGNVRLMWAYGGRMRRACITSRSTRRWRFPTRR